MFRQDQNHPMNENTLISVQLELDPGFIRKAPNLSLVPENKIYSPVGKGEVAKIIESMKGKSNNASKIQELYISTALQALWLYVSFQE